MDAQLPSKLPFSKKRLRARIVISKRLQIYIRLCDPHASSSSTGSSPSTSRLPCRTTRCTTRTRSTNECPSLFALAISGGFPLLVILVYTIVLDGLFSHSKPVNVATGKRKMMGKYRLKDRLWELNCGILGLVLAQGAAFVITGALKNACGKPRPDLIDRCKPRTFDQPEFGLSNYTICTQTNHEILKDGFRSFPSASFAGLFYLSLYLAGKLHVMDSRGEVWKAFIVMVPTLSAGLVAVSRIMDARHHPFDVISGSLLGVGCGWVAYRQYFPSLSEPWKKGRAYPIRTWGSIPEPPVYTHRRLLEYENDQVKLVPRTDEEYQAAEVSQDPPHGVPESTPALMSNPFEQQQVQRRRRLADPDYGASSSESEGYEMQQTRYEPRHHQAAETSSDAAPRYAAYHPDNRTPSSSPPLERHPASLVKS
ncbi:PAP2 domain-containing protein [Nannizzia gypsea CBS 118893]|uniref:PAP2 domain-containing protein n=1 Tax=Arthroderma gypseum (strain ATCC MYA-4604 / CBS 118893) TaxID=535722 RepID=E4UNS1_ARTGP|nr:PAP2 domain-containing protein [Nannizzia gypsea CBS 118893]EFQ99674.1 PAP2 domain-containing protein [Nannizzia gypsea CBS 118893]